jgi:hypothetical protein
MAEHALAEYARFTVDIMSGSGLAHLRPVIIINICKQHVRLFTALRHATCSYLFEQSFNMASSDSGKPPG